MRPEVGSQAGGVTLTTRIGVLALQGDVEEHRSMLERAGARSALVKREEHLQGIDGLVIPGGESTTIGKLLRRFDLLQPLQRLVHSGFPVYGTCAGMILLADDVQDAAADQPSVGGMHISVQRNAFGRQRESFETEVSIPDLPGDSDEPFHAVFIRAPVITRLAPDVQVLAQLDDGRPVAARQGHLLASSFHPELTDDSRIHEYFLDMVRAL